MAASVCRPVTSGAARHSRLPGGAQGGGVFFMDGAVGAARLGLDADAVGANDVVGHGAQDAAR